MSFRFFLFCAFLICSVVLPSQAVEISQLQARAGQGERKSVLKELNEYLSQTPDDYAALFLKARLLEQTDQTAEAENIYRRLIALNPVRPEAYNNLAGILVADDDLAAAQVLLEQALRADPSYAAVYDNLSHIYVAMARDSYGKALRLKPGGNRLELVELTMLSAKAASGPKINSTTSTAPAIETNKPDVQLTLRGKKQATIPSHKPTTTFNESEIITTLEGWAAAWSEQAADVYFIFYADDYHPPGQSRRSWQRDRRARLKKPSWIQIGLKDIEVRPISNKEAQVKLIQVYRASNYQDMTKKEMKLRQTPDGWRIVAERSVSNVK